MTWVSIWIRNNSIHIIYSDSNDNTCTGLTSFYKAKLSYFVQTGVEKILKLIRHAYQTLKDCVTEGRNYICLRARERQTSVIKNIYIKKHGVLVV